MRFPNMVQQAFVPKVRGTFRDPESRVHYGRAPMKVQQKHMRHADIRNMINVQSPNMDESRRQATATSSA